MQVLSDVKRDLGIQKRRKTAVDIRIALSEDVETFRVVVNCRDFRLNKISDV
jgi:hypothetical protein